MRPSRVVAPVALGVALVLVGVRWWLRPAATSPPIVGTSFPSLALAPLPPTLPLTDASLRRGEPTVVNVFASWCVPCRAESAKLAALRGRGVAVAGVAVRDTPADVASFLRTTGTRYDLLGLDARERVQAALGTTGIPETWVVDGQGVVRARFRGDLHVEDVPRVLAAVAAAR